MSSSSHENKSTISENQSRSHPLQICSIPPSPKAWSPSPTLTQTAEKCLSSPSNPIPQLHVCTCTSFPICIIPQLHTSTSFPTQFLTCMHPFPLRHNPSIAHIHFPSDQISQLLMLPYSNVFHIPHNILRNEVFSLSGEIYLTKNSQPMNHNLTQFNNLQCRFPPTQFSDQRCNLSLCQKI